MINHHTTSNVESFTASMRSKLNSFRTVLESARRRIPHFQAQRWVPSKTVDGLKILKSETCVEGSDICAYRARAILPFRTTRKPWEILKHVMMYYTDPRLTKRYLPLLHPYFSFYNSYHVKDEIYVLHCRFSSGTFIVKDRDYLNVRNLYRDDEKCYFLSCSVPERLTEEDWPRDNQCVRGKLTLYACTIKDLGEGRVEFEYLSHGDPNGMIPSWITNWKAKEEALILLRYKKLLGHWLQQRESPVDEGAPVPQVGRRDPPDTDQQILPPAPAQQQRDVEERPAVENPTEENQIQLGSGMEEEEEVEDEEDIEEEHESSSSEMKKLESVIHENNREIRYLKEVISGMSTEREGFSALHSQRTKKREVLALKYLLIFLICIQGFYPNPYTALLLALECFLKAFWDVSIILFLYRSLSVERIQFLVCGAILGMLYMYENTGYLPWIIVYYCLNAVLLISILTDGVIENLLRKT